MDSDGPKVMIITHG